MTDQVNHPSHYGGDTVYETIKVLEAWLTYDEFIGFCRGQAIAYLSRVGKKHRREGEMFDDTDLKKAIFYINYEIDFRQRALKGQVGENRSEIPKMGTRLIIDDPNQDPHAR